jgi:hypothetical protein
MFWNLEVSSVRFELILFHPTAKQVSEVLLCPHALWKVQQQPPLVEKDKKVTTTIVLLDTADHDTVGRVEASGSNKGERTERDVKRAHPSLGGGSGVSSLEVLELDSCSTYTID